MKNIKHKKKIYIPITLLTVVVFCLFLLYLRTLKNSEENLVFETAIIEYGSIENSITATGTVEPIIQVEVGTQVSGIIDKIYVDYNSAVKRGQILAELDKTILEQELKSSESDMNSCKNEFDFQKKTFERTEVLFNKNLVSQNEYDQMLYGYQKAQNSYLKAQASYKKAKTNLGYATIYSPIDGLVLSRAVDVGQTVAASFSTPTLFTIANNLKEMQVIADVDEADIGNVEEGMTVSFYVDAFPDNVFTGKVTQVRLEPTITNNVVTYEVVINAPNPGEKLKPGLTANVSIYSLEKQNILLLPIKALYFDPTNKSQKENKGKTNDSLIPLHVYVSTKMGQIEKREIRVGATDGIFYEILSGLKENELVCTSFNEASELTSNVGGGESSPFMPKRPGSNSKNSKNNTNSNNTK